MEVYQVHEQLLAHAAHKAAGMPAHLGAQALGKDHNVTAGELFIALQWEEREQALGIYIV